MELKNMKRSWNELIDSVDVLATDLMKPEFRPEWERLTVPRELSLYLLKVRTERKLTETAFARQLGMSQPAYSRLELGEHVPTIPTLRRLASSLGVTFRIDIRPDGETGADTSSEVVDLWPLPESNAADEKPLQSAAD